MRELRFRAIQEEDYSRVADMYFWEFCGNPSSAEEILNHLRKADTYGYVAKARSVSENASSWQIVAFCFIDNWVVENSCGIKVNPNDYDFEVQALVSHVSVRRRTIMSRLLYDTTTSVLNDYPNARICCRAFGYYNIPNAKTALARSGYVSIKHVSDVYANECPYNPGINNPDACCGVHPAVCGLHCSMDLYEYRGPIDPTIPEVEQYI